MKKITDIFSKDELDYLSRERPDLVPMEVPSIEENIEELANSEIVNRIFN